MFGSFLVEAFSGKALSGAPLISYPLISYPFWRNHVGRQEVRLQSIPPFPPVILFHEDIDQHVTLKIHIVSGVEHQGVNTAHIIQVQILDLSGGYRAVDAITE